MTTLQHPAASTPPRVVNDPRFRAAISERLVVLRQDCPGLAVRVTGGEKAVVLFPRDGRIESGENLLSFLWLSVEISDAQEPFEFTAMSREEVLEFLARILRKS